MYHGTRRSDQATLAAQLKYLARNFRVTPLEVLVQARPGDSDGGPPRIALTFDDGLRNNFTVLYPLLRDLDIPATFFVCPGLIESGRWLWNHEMRCRLQGLSREGLAEVARSLGTSSEGVEGVINWMKTLSQAQRTEAEELVRSATPGFLPSREEHEAFDLMSWQELLTLDPRLITIGSHTLTHPILTNLTHQQAEEEVIASRLRLETKLGRNAGLFCYPNGSYDPHVYRLVRANYQAAVSTEVGVLKSNPGSDLHRIPRIPSAVSAALTAWRLHRPGA